MINSDTVYSAYQWIPRGQHIIIWNLYLLLPQSDCTSKWEEVELDAVKVDSQLTDLQNEVGFPSPAWQNDAMRPSAVRAE